MAASDHREAGGAVEERRPVNRGDGLLAGVDQVGIFVALHRKGADAQQAVLGVEDYVDPLGDVVRHEGRDADAQVDVHAVLELAGGPLRQLFSGKCHGSCSRWF